MSTTNPGGAKPIEMCTTEGILAVPDVVAATTYYRGVLGFKKEWHWDTPVTFGGVRWDKINVMFCRQPELAARIEGHQHAIFLSGVDQLYELHKKNGAAIISPLENKPWGLREYMVRDLNGYHLRFGEGIEG